MFEKGGWEESEAESDEEDDQVGRAEWDLERLRLETEGERAVREERRLAGEGDVEEGKDIEDQPLGGD